MLGRAVSGRGVPEVASKYDEIQSVCKPIDIIAFQLDPARSSFFGQVQGVGILQHDALFVAVDTFAESFQNVVIIGYFLKFHDLDDSGLLLHNFL